MALDLGTRTGWSLLANGIRTSGSQGFQRYAGSKSRPQDHVGQPFLSFQRWIRERIQTDKPAAIVYEDVYRWSSGDAAKCYGSFRGVLLVNCAYCGIPVYGYSPSAVKKSWTGSGIAKKEQMMAVTKARFPELELTDDNEADAIALLYLHVEKTGASKTTIPDIPMAHAAIIYT